MKTNFNEAKLLELILKHCESFDSKTQNSKAFLQQFTGAILLLVPEAAAFLVENGLPDDDETIKKAILIVSDALRELAHK